MLIQSKIFVLLVLIFLCSCGGGGNDSSQGNTNDLPNFINSPIITTTYDGIDNDLLSAGLGQKGIESTTPPGYRNPLNPTADELRRNAIYMSYRLIDTTSGGGFGQLYGPSVDSNGSPVPGDGLIAGKEYLVYADDDTVKVTLMVQLPDNFDVNNPCIVAVSASGSGTVYAPVSTAGDWGLKRKCAVVYNNKGGGIGFHDLQKDLSYNIRGQLVSAQSSEASFRADIAADALGNFNQSFPNRFAVKHAHSKTNTWSKWGTYVLWSIQFAFYILNEELGDKNNSNQQIFTSANTLVIAAGISNGGGAAIKALEDDREGLIDGLAVSEPNIHPPSNGNFVIAQGNQIIDSTVHSKGLVDFTSLIAIYQPCASLAPTNANAPFNQIPIADATARCASLYDKGLLSALTTSEQAIEAQSIINANGINIEQNFLQPHYTSAQIPQSLLVLFTNMLGRFGVEENLCGFSYGATDENAFGIPTELSRLNRVMLFTGLVGAPPSGGVNIINNDSANGPIDYRFAHSPSTGRMDQSLDAFLCLREHMTSERVIDGIADVRVTGNLLGKPAVIVAGRNDAILPINHTSRPYYAFNQLAEGSSSHLRYYEIKNAQHLDSFNGVSEYAERFVPLYYYYSSALNIIYNHLRSGTPLPPSQIIRTIPRGLGTPALEVEQNLPSINIIPSIQSTITFENNILTVPE